MHGSDVANYVSGSGTDTLSFELALDSDHEVRDVDLNGGAIVACEASARLRPANLSLPAASRKFTTRLQEPVRYRYRCVSQGNFFAFLGSSAGFK